MTHTKEAEKYVREITSGKLPACRWVVLACKRHLKDLERSKEKSFPFRFDEAKANKICNFAEFLPHTKGEWCFYHHDKQEWNTIHLQPWQKFVLCSLFGWVKKTNGMRRFTKASLYIPRKNAKSTLAACIGLYMLLEDGEPGAEVYSGATSRDQAMMVFRTAWIMVKKCPDLQAKYGVVVTGSTIPGALIAADGSKFEPIIGKPGDGSSPHCALIDEYHEHPNSDLRDTMETGMGARRQPLSLIISTAGSNIAGPCRQDWKVCEQVLAGKKGFVDETVFAVMWTIDDPEKWDLKKSLAIANPNWGISVNPEQVAPAVEAAKYNPEKQATVKTKYFNLWVQAKEAYYNIDAWEKLANPNIKPEDYKAYPCLLGGDFASKHDIVALMQLFVLPEEKYALFGKYYLPEDTINLPENQHYQNWERTGWLTKTPGSITDLEYLTNDAEEMMKQCNVEEMVCDPNRAWGVFPQLQKRGLPVVEYRNTVLFMSEPTKQLDALIRSGRIVHNGDPVLAWAISNVTAKLDKKENVYPNKDTARNKIDPVVSTLFALGRAMVRTGEPATSGFSFG